MKLLLDENLPKRLKKDFPSHITLTVFEMGWAGFQNGKLLSLMIEQGIDALLTFDKNLQHQQNFTKYSVFNFERFILRIKFLPVRLKLPVIAVRLSFLYLLFRIFFLYSKSFSQLNFHCYFLC